MNPQVFANMLRSEAERQDRERLGVPTSEQLAVLQAIAGTAVAAAQVEGPSETDDPN
jgi:hypothetical protein